MTKDCTCLKDDETVVSKRWAAGWTDLLNGPWDLYKCTRGVPACEHDAIRRLLAKKDAALRDARKLFDSTALDAREISAILEQIDEAITPWATATPPPA